MLEGRKSQFIEEIIKTGESKFYKKRLEKV